MSLVKDVVLRDDAAEEPLAVAGVEVQRAEVADDARRGLAAEAEAVDEVVDRLRALDRGVDVEVRRVHLDRLAEAALDLLRRQHRRPLDPARGDVAREALRVDRDLVGSVVLRLRDRVARGEGRVRADGLGLLVSEDVLERRRLAVRVAREEVAVLVDEGLRAVLLVELVLEVVVLAQGADRAVAEGVVDRAAARPRRDAESAAHGVGALARAVAGRGPGLRADLLDRADALRDLGADLARARAQHRPEARRAEPGEAARERARRGGRGAADRARSDSAGRRGGDATRGARRDPRPDRTRDPPAERAEDQAARGAERGGLQDTLVPGAARGDVGDDLARGARDRTRDDTRDGQHGEARAEGRDDERGDRDADHERDPEAGIGEQLRDELERGLELLGDPL